MARLVGGTPDENLRAEIEVKRLILQQQQDTEYFFFPETMPRATGEVRETRGLKQYITTNAREG